MATQDEREKRRRAAALSLLLFSPWKRLRPHIAMAAHDIDSYFDSVDYALDTTSIGRAVGSGDRLGSALERLVTGAMISGYEDGASLSGVKVTRDVRAHAASAGAQRAAEVQEQMAGTSKLWLKDDPNHPFALSTGRAERAARYEAGRAYYQGLQSAVRGSGVGKRWLTTSENPCEDCLDNEDAGVISVDDVFPSGDDAPLAHLNCQCVLEIVPEGE